MGHSSSKDNKKLLQQSPEKSRQICQKLIEKKEKYWNNSVLKKVSKDNRKWFRGKIEMIKGLPNVRNKIVKATSKKS